MIRTVPLIAAAFGTSLMLFGANVAPAYAAAPVYRAVPVAAVQTAENVIVGETLWKCAPAGCTTTSTTSRPAIICAQAAKKVGKLESFSVGTEAFDADALAKCNAKAKDAPTALARN